MTFLAALLALIDEFLKSINLAQTSAQREQDRQAGADALAAATNQAAAEIADAQSRNDLAPRDIDGIARSLRAGAAVGSDGAGDAVRPADQLVDGAKK